VHFGTALEDRSRHVVFCGWIMKCRHCGAENRRDGKFCTRCGKRLPKPQTSPVAILLLILIVLLSVYWLRVQQNSDARASLQNETSFVIRVAGDRGLKFRGSYVTIVSGSSSSQSVEGTVPA